MSLRRDPLRFTLVADGPTDGDMLAPILRWLLRQHCPQVSVEVEFADTRSSSQKLTKLERKIVFALASYPCDCLFIHRDAKREPIERRHDEITRAITSLRPEDHPPAQIAVVPVRMSEAWLLFDESAIRRAAGNPNGRVAFDLPRLATLEALPDPKALLYQLLSVAADLPKRRRRNDDPTRQSRRVADRIDDFSPLRSLSAFQRLETEVEQLCQARGWSV